MTMARKVIAYNGNVVVLPNGSPIESSGERVYEDYTGPYEASPLVTTQVLQTNDKHMTDDVTFFMIRTVETPNPQGGVTFEILG